MNRIKKIVASLLILLLVVGLVSGGIYAQSVSDIKGHTAESTIVDWIDKGFVSGYPDGTFKPNKTVTRAEFVKMVNTVFAKNTTDDIKLTFSDVKETHWAYKDIKTAIEFGIANGTSSTTFSPDQVVTKQEAVVMLNNLLKLKGDSTLSYLDADKVATWAKEAVGVLGHLGIIEADPNGNIDPKKPLSRAEVVVLLNNTNGQSETVFTESGIQGDRLAQRIINGNVKITSSNTTLQNMKISGHLFIDKAVGEGEIHLQNVEVLGQLIVQGGGDKSIFIEDSYLKGIFANKKSSSVRIVATGSSKIDDTLIHASTKLEELDLTSNGFINVDLSKSVPSNTLISLVGSFEYINVLSQNVKINIANGVVNKLTIEEQALNNSVSVAKDATITSLIVNEISSFLGEGTIEKAYVGTKAQGILFGISPKSMDGPVELSDAKLKDITFNTTLTYQMMKKNENQASQFSPGYFDYVISVDAAKSKQNLQFELKHEPKATVFVHFDDESGYENFKLISEDKEGKYNVMIDTTKRQYFEVAIISANEAYNNVYTFFVQPSELDVNEFFHLSPAGLTYAIHSYALLPGDKINITVPAKDASHGEQFTASLVVPNTSHGSFYYIYEVIQAEINNKFEYFKPSNNVGELPIEVWRGTSLIASGTYNYDVTKVTAEILDPSTYSLRVLTTNDVIQYNKNSNSSYKLAFGFKYSIDEAKLKAKHGDFAYYKHAIYYGNTDSIVKEQTKILEGHQYLPSKVFSESFKYREHFEFYSPSWITDGSGKYTLHQEIYEHVLFLYDDNRSFIKIVTLPVKITKENLNPDVVLASKS